VVVSNLQPSVSQEDIVELFGDVGALKRAKVTTPGTAEVVYVNLADALKAIEVYHNRQLDGRSMKCQIVGLAANSL
jgi:RNA recognition motif-containing protein